MSDKPIVFRNIATDGARELVILNRVIEFGEEFEVTPEQAALLFLQPDVWACVSGEKAFAHLLEAAPEVAPEIVAEPVLDEAINLGEDN